MYIPNSLQKHPAERWGTLLVRTFLPVQTWFFEKIFSDVFTGGEWRAYALSLVPPPDSLANTIEKCWADFDSPALISPSARRRLRRWVQGRLRRSLRNDPMVGPARQFFCQFRRDLEEKGLQEELGHTFKWRDIEADINSRWEQAIKNNDFPEELRHIAKEYPDAPNFLWELVLYGQSETRPKLHRKSALFNILGINREKLIASNPEEFFTLIFSLILSFGRLNGDTLDETRIIRLTEWLVRNTLPRDTEPETTPRALNMAKQAGLIHKAIVVRNGETAEIREIDIEDTSAPQLGDQKEKLTPDEIIEIFKEQGIDKDELTDKEWRFIFQLTDTLQFVEIGSKKGLSFNASLGGNSINIRQKLSRLRKKIARLKAKKN